MKYHQKLNLRSPVYKHQETSKSPLRSPKAQNNNQFLNATQLFQKVCCPNCKYSFKIIKSQSLIQDKIKSNSFVNRKKDLQNKQIQTDNVFLNVQQNISAQKSYAKHKSFNISSKLQLSRRNQISRINQILGNQNIDTSHIKQSDYKFKPLSLTPKNFKNKSIQLLKTLQNRPNISPFKKQIVKQQQTKINENLTSEKVGPSLLINQSYMISPQTPNKNTSKLEVSKIKKLQPFKTSKTSQKQQNSPSKIYQKQIEYQKNQNTLKCEAVLLKQLVKNIQNQNVINQLITYCDQLKTQNQIPAYCKMLLYSGNLQ